jgi:hypothetical protein
MFLKVVFIRYKYLKYARFLCGVWENKISVSVS